MFGRRHGLLDNAQNRLKGIYDRCLDFNESKKDSLCYYARYVETESDKISFVNGKVLSLRLYGLCHEFQSDFEKAIDYYLQSLDEAKRIKVTAYEISALSDLAIAYAGIQRPIEARQFYLQCARLSLQSGEINTVVNCYNNLGVIYSQLKQYDSALLFLQEALRIGAEAGDLIDHSGTYNNIGNIYFERKEFTTALKYFSKNYLEHSGKSTDLTSLWTDHLNIADTYCELKQLDSADRHASKAMELMILLGSKSKEANTYSLFAKIYERRGDYTKAYYYLKKWYTLDTAIVNSSTQNTVANLQERFNAKERNAQNKILLERVEKERYRNRSMTFLAIAFAVIGILIAIAFFIKRKANYLLRIKNEFIRKQNERLEELNYEKNSLISVVSHDLTTPFATIQMWGQLLEADKQQLNDDQQKALQRIKQAGSQGQELIQRILDVEQTNIGSHKLLLEEFDCSQFTQAISEDYKIIASQKNILIYTDIPGKPVLTISDKQLLYRLVENLLSNAIKYSPCQSTVWLKLEEIDETIFLHVRDEGPGISKEEIPFLFLKYTKLTARPTAGEPSTGLGLSIAKRIAEELNAKIYCESEPGIGSVFTVQIKNNL